MRLKSTMFALLVTVAFAMQAATPKYIFYFIGDGMGMGPAVATEMYNRQVLGNDKPITMMQFPVAGMCLTYSASSPVTDSAAAGTALSTGTKTKNGMLGMNPDTVAVYSLAADLKREGYGIGIATSVSPDDATPGAFYAHVPNRAMSYEIGVQAAQSGYEFIAGAGLRGEKNRNGEPTDLVDIIEKSGYQIIRGPKDWETASSDKIILLNNPGTSDNDIGYAIDSIQGSLTLPFITEACLSHLQKVSPDAFFMMVEGGAIDHALHANDGATAIKEILSFNEALDIAYSFYKEHPDETLIVVTADHDTGGMTIGNPFLGYMAKLQYVDSQVISKEQFQQFCRHILETRTAVNWDDMKEYLTEYFGFWTVVPVNEKQTEELKERYEETFERREGKDQKTLYADFNGFVVDVFKIFNDQAGMGFVATSHTGNPVPVFAVGVGAERFSKLNNNIEIPETILEIANYGRN